MPVKISLEKKAKDHNSSFKTYAYGRLNVIKKIKQIIAHGMP